MGALNLTKFIGFSRFDILFTKLDSFLQQFSIRVCLSRLPIRRGNSLSAPS